MLSEIEMQQIITTLEYACFVAEDSKAVFVNDVLQILGGYTEESQEQPRQSDYPRVGPPCC